MILKNEIFSSINVLNPDHAVFDGFNPTDDFHLTSIVKVRLNFYFNEIFSLTKFCLEQRILKIKWESHSIIQEQISNKRFCSNSFQFPKKSILNILLHFLSIIILY